ncbi:hydroxymethylglutaryl coenzyme A lyase [Trichuris trichiura]|uniref:hydroxymethylglutaryl-CoA lyase n=1 Tax=Trichuris trichiura TaxID=36087 RepID=A0A077YXX1_TRITR|nr:hydroxymethylglutaryl coenzyme A lyase [Trichuris trichiura]
MSNAHNRSISKDKVTVVEVGLRDGLQNEKTTLPTEIKLELIRRLTAAGLRVIEATSFVSAKKVPQAGLADHAKLFGSLNKDTTVRYPVLVPNVQGLRDAVNVHLLFVTSFKSDELQLKLDVKEIAVLVAATDAFSKKNINCDIEESFNRLEQIRKTEGSDKLSIRAYVSCAFGCPYDGKVKIGQVRRIVERLNMLGCSEVSLADTIGVGTPGTVFALLDELLSVISPSRIAVHFHNTYGQALANVLVALSMGIRTIDSSVAGLGGCPFVKSATGNLATEDLINMLDSLNIESGVRLDALIETSQWISTVLNRRPQSYIANNFGCPSIE